jgi:ubiquinone/menaquinone biosynthesis C-methylase UbiE
VRRQTKAMDLMSDDPILKYWEAQAAEHGSSHWASWGDEWMIELEIETIGAHIFPGQRVLDVGCANGYSAFRQLRARKPEAIFGVDFSRKMIAAANAKKAEHKFGSEVLFEEGDVRHLRFPDKSFDVVYTTRVLINLSTWEEQKQGIQECVRVAKEGGTIVLSEAFWEPLVSLNALRLVANLPPLVEHDFNRYIKRTRMEQFLRLLRLNFSVQPFSSVYYLGSRFLRELVTNPDDYPGYSNPINRQFFELERAYSGGDFGIQQAVIIKK